MELLEKGAAQLGIALSGAQLDQFQVYYRELTDWNQRANLTAITGFEDVQVKHFLDSLTVCLAAGGLLAGLEARVIDVGSGAGLPGMALKLAFPGIRLTLVESVAKKTAFLERLTAILGLEGVSVLTGRSEALGREDGLRDAFDLVVVRGVARLPLLLEYCLPFCKPGGRLVALKHGGDGQELDAAANALLELGGRIDKVVTVALEGLTDDRVLISVAKTGPTPDRYPRRVGIPAKRPL
ncbi:MAG: 16S rRNA (guanine(527)-N(7))-methyltransferase RsmG [Chloroflexi bacterium]|nr:16S rRNA (guanine(527)-N(7))-methyltransferase RsmG [Chloroflexota bacterium]MDA1270737.1 16S rRNA (guanine(527)-N(7))-methyltransferase RsmG [Chloroflexota bacterium]PKB58151.1 MAG: 16S rRNA (guanine(527)-N(7))-methyltransferase RsmG [SAR202 cluster bacterium Casp-Chloro-G2]